MRPMYCFHLWQRIQIKEASEDMDVKSKKCMNTRRYNYGWTLTLFAVSNRWWTLCFHSKGNRTSANSGRTHHFQLEWLSKPECIAQPCSQLCQWASGMLKCPWAGFRIYRSSGEAVLEPYLTSDPLVQMAKKRDVQWGIRLSTKDSLGESLSHQGATHKTKSEKTFRIGFATCWIWEPWLRGSFCRLGANEAILFSSQISPQTRDKNHKHSSYSTNHSNTIARQQAGTSQSLWPNRK